MRKKIARVIWNKTGWVLPSGKPGKSQDKDSFEFQNGYGHDEWLFDNSKIIDGFHYGFLQPITRYRNVICAERFDILLYSIDGYSKIRYFVAKISNVEIICKEEAAKIKKRYADLGWLAQMKQNVIDVSGDYSKLDDLEGIDIFNVKFQISDVYFYDYMQIPTTSRLYQIQRYNLINFIEEYYIDTEKKKDFIFIPNKKDAGIDNNILEKRIIDLPQRQVEITYWHKLIQNRLFEHFKNQYGDINVSRENEINCSTKRIDLVVRKHDGSFIFFEIKTYNSALSGVREAIGQLFEYSFWPNKSNADELVIVTSKQSDSEGMSEYFRHLRVKLNINLFYQWYDVVNDILSDKM